MDSIIKADLYRHEGHSGMKGFIKEWFIPGFRYPYVFRKGFYLTSHCEPVIIGQITIGRNCNISHSVTLGRSYKGGVIGRPTVGDLVWIGPGSVLVGNRPKF